MENIMLVPATEAMEAPSAIPALLDEIHKGLGTSEMSLDAMVLEMRLIRESSNYEAEA